ncbi:MAG: RNA polymerase sigma factor [Saprospiraceae bacterium]|jgi:RNA polymerase sigma factor (sigma-70 family)
MDEKTLISLYRNCYPDIARYIMNRGGSSAQAEEAFHAALGSMLHQINKGATIQDFGAYLFRSAWNAFLAEHKVYKRNKSSVNSLNEEDDWSRNPSDHYSLSRDSFTFEPQEPGPEPDVQVHQQILMEAAEASMSELTTAQQTILKLSFDPGLNLDDEGIAQKLGVTRDYVRVARFRAMEALRAKMHKRGYGYMM